MDMERPDPSTRLVYLCVVLFILVVILAHIFDQWRVPMPELILMTTDPAVIRQVLPGGSAEAAGLRAGDVILRMNGDAFNPDYLPDIVRPLRVGQMLSLEVSRAGRVLHFSTPLVTAIQLTLLNTVLSTIVALVFMAAGALLLLRRELSAEVRLLFGLSQAVALGALFPSFEWIAWYTIADWYVPFAAFGAFASVALLVHFHATFPVVLGSPRQRRLGLSILYGLCALLVISWTATNFMNLPYGWLVGLLDAVIGLAMIASALVLLVTVYLRKATPDGRQRLRLIIFGDLVAAAGPLFYLAPAAILGYPLIPEWLMWPCLGFAPLAYVVATLRHNLFGIDRVLNRTVVYLLLTSGILGLYVLPILALDRLGTENWASRAFFITLLTLLMGLIFGETRLRIQRLVDRLFYGGWYDYAGVVAEVSIALAGSLEWSQLAGLLAFNIPARMQLVGGQLEIEEQSTPGLDLNQETALHFSFTFENQPCGGWTLGPRLDGRDFTDTDRRILQTLAHQAETAARNMLLVKRLLYQLDEIRASRELLTRIERRLLRTREEERTRLARELHDGPIQSLIQLNIELGMLSAPAQPSFNPVIDSMRAEVKDLLAGLRGVCAELRPPMLDTLGLGAALRSLIRDWSAQSNVTIDLDLAPDAVLRGLPGDVAVNLFRVAQEGLSNVARHARASRVWLAVQWDGHPGSLRMVIWDDGCGFLLDGIPDRTMPNHYGLVGMQERVALIGGQWHLETAPGQGTRLEVIWQPSAPE